MAGEFERYAVYWVPKRVDPLAQFGISWTGWCAEQGEPRTLGSFGGFGLNIASITRHTRRHGLHGVVKAPFALGDGRSRFSLEHSLGRLVEESVSFKLPRLELGVVDGRVSLVPKPNFPALGELVSRIDEALAPLGSGGPASGFAESPVTGLGTARARDADAIVQLPAGEAHRFHVPLTDPLGVETAFQVMENLRPILEPALEHPRRIQDLALMGDPGGGRPLRVLLRYDLRDTPLRKASSALPCQGPEMLVPTFDGRFVKTDIAI
jgi:hypothetical protein